MITSYAVGILLLKLTVVLSVTLFLMPLMRRATAALRHLLCATGMAAALLLPLTLLPHSTGIAVPVPLLLRTSALATTANPEPHGFYSAVLAVWAAGAALFLVRLCIGYRRMSHAILNSELSSSAGEVPVVVADVSVPIITGLFRPVILLPQSASHWPRELRDAALRHELTHLRRKDLWVNLLSHLTCAVYWFHPLAWLLAFRLRTEQEIACDDAVIYSGFDAPVYAEALLAAARSITSTPLIGCPMITQISQISLRQRIARLLDRSVPRVSSPSILRRAAVLFAALPLVIGLLNSGPKLAAQTDTQVYKMSDGITPPKVIYKVDPGYTDEARDAKIAGTVTLSIVIGSDGLAHDISIVKSLDSGLDLKAVEAVQKWQFQPGQLNGENVAVRATIEINFRLV